MQLLSEQNTRTKYAAVHRIINDLISQLSTAKLACYTADDIEWMSPSESCQ